VNGDQAYSLGDTIPVSLRVWLARELVRCRLASHQAYVDVSITPAQDLDEQLGLASAETTGVGSVHGSGKCLRVIWGLWFEAGGLRLDCLMLLIWCLSVVV